MQAAQGPGMAVWRRRHHAPPALAAAAAAILLAALLPQAVAQACNATTHIVASSPDFCTEFCTEQSPEGTVANPLTYIGERAGRTWCSLEPANRCSGAVSPVAQLAPHASPSLPTRPRWAALLRLPVRAGTLAAARAGPNAAAPTAAPAAAAEPTGGRQPSGVSPTAAPAAAMAAPAAGVRQDGALDSGERRAVRSRLRSGGRGQGGGHHSGPQNICRCGAGLGGEVAGRLVPPGCVWSLIAFCDSSSSSKGGGRWMAAATIALRAPLLPAHRAGLPLLVELACLPVCRARPSACLQPPPRA